MNEGLLLPIFIALLFVLLLAVLLFNRSRNRTLWLVLLAVSAVVVSSVFIPPSHFWEIADTHNPPSHF